MPFLTFLFYLSLQLTQNEQKKIFHVTDQLALNLIFDQAVRANTGMLKAGKSVVYRIYQPCHPLFCYI